MSSRFDACHAITAVWEGGWSDHARDPGGKTMWGVTQATLAAYRGRAVSAHEIRNLTKAEAVQIYAAKYWRPVGGDDLPPGIDLCVYDFGVNSGPSRSVKSLQATLGVSPDGWVGAKTLEALAKRDPVELIDKLCDRRLAFLRRLPTWDAFGKGWSNRVADIRRKAKKMADGGKVALAVLPPDVAKEGAAKAVPPLPTEPKVSQEQVVGGVIGSSGVLTVLAAFWRDNRDLFTDPVFLAVAAVATAATVYMLFLRPKKVEEQ